MSRLSRAEEITNEVRKLVYTCRSLEAQLQQSVPKKFHQDIVAKMQANVDSLTENLASTRSELERTFSIAQRVGGLESQIAAQNSTISSQTKTIDSLTAESSTYASQYSQAVANVQELESKISTMVNYTEFASLQTRCSELESRIETMIPRDQFSAIQIELANSVPTQKYEDLQKRLEQMVPREYLTVAEGRIGELERNLSDSVPKTDFEELAGKITQLTKEAVEFANRASAAIGLEFPAVPEADSATASVPEAVLAGTEVAVSFASSTAPPEAPAPQAPVQITQPDTLAPTDEVVVPAPESPSVEPFVEPKTIQIETQTQPQEIAEVQSQLSEIGAAIETGASSLTPVQHATTVEAERGFRFSSTEFCARSGMEFLEDLEKVDISIVTAHCQSGDFERWFKDVLADETAAQSIQKIRESNVSGEEIRTMMVAAIASRYRA